VVANIKDALWESALRYNAVQLISIAKFTTAAGAAVFEIDGTFRVIDRSMGFARYSATDRSLLFPLKSGVPTGEIQIEDPTGSVGLWSAVATADHTWVTKKVGSPNLEDSTYVQMVRTSDGRFVLRKPL
jgi:hypothetical protein